MASNKGDDLLRSLQNMLGPTVTAINNWHRDWTKNSTLAHYPLCAASAMLDEAHAVGQAERRSLRVSTSGLSARNADLCAQ